MRGENTRLVAINNYWSDRSDHLTRADHESITALALAWVHLNMTCGTNAHTAVTKREGTGQFR